jgi:MarR family transcriptional regulator, organic hydroperoxide resistance regulator
VNTSRNAVCLCDSARRLSRRLTSLYEGKLKPCGLNPSQYIVLRNISELESALVTTLAVAVELDQSTITRNLAVLTKLGLIRIAKGHEDGRTRMVTLTAKGNRLVTESVPLWEQAHKEAKDMLGPKLSKLLLAAGA